MQESESRQHRNQYSAANCGKLTSVVIASSDGKVDTGVDRSVDGLVKESGLATTKRHVGSRALEALSLALLRNRDLLRVGSGGVFDTLDDIRHGARAVGAQDLDGLDVSLLGHTVLLASDCAGAVSAVSVAILVLVTLRNGLAPLGAALEVDVVNVGASVDDIDINSLTTIGGVEVLVEGTE